MSRNSISLSDEPERRAGKLTGRYKVRWREEVIEDGKPRRQAKSQIVSDKGARDILMAKLRRTLESGEVYEPAARILTTPANLEIAAVKWLTWQKARGKKKATLAKYKAALKRIMGTVRRVRRIRPDEVIPVTVLDAELFTALLNTWSAEDVPASPGGTKNRSAGPMRRYHLAGHLYSVWRWAASQPSVFALVPPLLANELVIPPVPAQPGAPEAPTWEECDAVIRRAYAVDVELGDVLAGERLTGLRVEQVTAIRRRAIDPNRMKLVVEIGKSKAEEAEMRTIPLPRSLLDLWQGRIAACKGPDDFLFPATNASGHVHPDTDVLRDLWMAAVKAGEVGPNVYQPLNRRKGRPNHGFRAAYMAGLQGLTAEIDDFPVQKVTDKTIDFLVGHRPPDIRSKHYTPPTWRALEAAVGAVTPIDMKEAPVVAEGNVLAGPWARS